MTGTLKSNAKGTCSICQAGTAPSADGLTCDACPEGKYSDRAGALTCSACPAGRFDSTITGKAAHRGSREERSDETLRAIVTRYRNINFHLFDAFVRRSLDAMHHLPGGKVRREYGTDILPGMRPRKGESGRVRDERVLNPGSSSLTPTMFYCLSPPQYRSDPGAALRSDCLSCDAGKYQDIVGGFSCLTCLKGKYSEVMSRKCSDCPAGKASSVLGASSCSDCELGKFQGLPSKLTCTSCALGTYADHTAAVTCVPCSGGQKGNADLQRCDRCPDGKFSNQGSATCTECHEKDGYVSLAGESGATQCTYCGPGYRSDKETNSCELCAAGKYSIGGSESCTICPAGTDGARGSIG